MVAYSRFNVTEDTSEGSIASGGDLTAALQEAASGCRPAPGHFRNLFCPPGVFEISDTVTFPYRSGGKFLGEGPTDPDISSDKQGVGTVFKWTGPDDGRPMFKFTGTNWEIGDWTMWASGYSNAVGLAWGRPTGADGLGTGKSWHRPMRFVGFNRAIQLREDGDTILNCDNLYFDDIEAENCHTIVHMNSVNVMDIVVRKLHVSNCVYGFYVQGGGQLHLEHAMIGYTNSSTTLLYIPADSNVADNNGKFVLECVKVDNQMGSDFTMVESHEMFTHQVHVAYALISPTLFDGNFATITGRCFMTLDCCQGSYKKITGVESDENVTPTVLVTGCHAERPFSEVFLGDIRYRLQENVEWAVQWRDDSPGRDVYVDGTLYNPTAGASGAIVWL